jgi:hypothetical protein
MSVTSIAVVHFNNGRALFDVLAAALPSNSTLRHLVLHQKDNDDPDRLSPIFSALGRKTGVKTLTATSFGSMDESLCTAMKYGLGINETLETLELSCVPLFDDNAALW